MVYFQVDLFALQRTDTLHFYYEPENEIKTVSGLTYRNPLIGYTVKPPVEVSQTPGLLGSRYL